MAAWFNNEILGITIGQYVTAFGIVLVAFRIAVATRFSDDWQSPPDHGLDCIDDF